MKKAKEPVQTPALDKVFVIGVDPGSPITLAMLDPKGEWIAHAKPGTRGATSKNNVWLFMDVLKKWKKHADDKGVPVVAVIEDAHPRPREGVVSVGKYMGSFWMAKTGCAALNIPYTIVSPRRWKPRLGLNSDKAPSLELARRTFKERGRATWRLKRKKDHDYAEAAMIAYYLRHYEPTPTLPDEHK